MILHKMTFKLSSDIRSTSQFKISTQPDRFPYKPHTGSAFSLCLPISQSLTFRRNTLFVDCLRLLQMMVAIF